MTKIAESETPFASRGDDSGTHKAELRLWKEAGIDAQAASGGWYRETGSGMGATLNTGTSMGAYVLTDRATWIAFGNKGDEKTLAGSEMVEDRPLAAPGRARHGRQTEATQPSRPQDLAGRRLDRLPGSRALEVRLAGRHIRLEDSPLVC